MKHFSVLLLLPTVLVLTSCGSDTAADKQLPSAAPRTGVSEIEAPSDDRLRAGQTLYVPAYPSIFTSDRGHAYRLAITLCVRNTDERSPMIVKSVKYYDQEGKLIRDYLPKPVQISPLASVSYFVAENDVTGGIGACFLVEWVADQAVTPPVVEAVMVGTSGQQGVSFICPGRVLEDRARPSPESQ